MASMRKGFLMTSDALLALIIISSSIFIMNQLLINKPSYENDYLQSVTDDAATLIEKSEINNILDIINNAPRTVCLSSTVSLYNGNVLINSTKSVSSNCPSNYFGTNTLSRRTYVNNNDYYLITVTGFYKREWLTV
jgi:hypothetical protein